MNQYPPIEVVLPHRPPMILLDRIVDTAGDSMTCTVALRDETPFVENGRLSAVVVTECMAQCVAAYAGLKAFLRGGPVQVGYVIGARRIVLEVDSFSVGEELTVRAEQIWSDDSLGKFECLVESNGCCVASATLTVFQGPIDPAQIAWARS